jgi:hypothetical protein
MAPGRFEPCLQRYRKSAVMIILPYSGTKSAVRISCSKGNSAPPVHTVSRSETKSLRMLDHSNTVSTLIPCE